MTNKINIPDEAVQAAADKYSDGGGHGLDMPDIIEVSRDMIAAALPYLSAPCAVEVTKLEWVQQDGKLAWDSSEYRIYDLLGSKPAVYRLLKASFGTQYAGDFVGVNALEAAKAAAQADFDRRTLSQIVTKPFDVASALLDTQITENVISFLVSHDMIDESDEYSLQDIMAALYDNYTPNKPVDVAAVRDPILTEAIVSDEAVQAALDKCDNVDWVQGLFGTGLSGREIIESALTAAAPYLTASVEVGDDGNKHYIVWNEDRTEGFITDDQSDADQVYEGEFYGAYSSLGYAFHEAYGDNEKHLETVCLDAIRALSPAEPVEQCDFDKADWFYRDIDPDDSGDAAHEAIVNHPEYSVHLIHSSYRGDSRYAFRAPTLNLDDDDDEVLHFSTEAEALSEAHKRKAEIEALNAAPTSKGGE